MSDNVMELRPAKPQKGRSPVAGSIDKPNDFIEAVNAYCTDLSNHMTHKLTQALGLIDMLQHRYEGHHDALANIFGGLLHTDANALYTIEDLIKDALEQIEKPDKPA